MSAPLGPGELAGRLAELTVDVARVSVETGPVEIPGYYGDGARPRGVVVLEGGALEGRGECVAWSAEAQAEFAALAPALVPAGRTTVGGLEARLRRVADDPYHRAAIEGAAIDLALAQAGTNPFEIAGRAPRPVSFCRSLHPDGDPVGAVDGILARDPDARVKIDCPEEGWPDPTWEGLAATGRIVVVDFKRKGAPDAPARAHRWLPRAWLEDPPEEALDRLDGRESGDWGARVSLDGYVKRATDLDRPPFRPAAVNVKAARMGGWLEALRCLETCRLRGWHAYVGGMFEVDAGRGQARVLAALYCADSWNDLAPIGEPAATSPAILRADYAGFAPA